jgi:hypothetical protein
VQELHSLLQLLLRLLINVNQVTSTKQQLGHPNAVRQTLQHQQLTATHVRHHLQGTPSFHLAV